VKLIELVARSPKGTTRLPVTWADAALPER